MNPDGTLIIVRADGTDELRVPLDALTLAKDLRDAELRAFTAAHKKKRGRGVTR